MLFSRSMKLPHEPSARSEAILASFREILSYRFQNPALLVRALGAWNLPLTPEAATDRQRLEFLGDAAWNYAIAVAACQAWPHASAGDLTRLRSLWCSTAGLAGLARQIGFPAPDGPAAPVPTERMLAEMFEAVIGAMVEDGGLEPVQALAHRVIAQVGAPQELPPVDPKSALQILAQTRFRGLPSYRLLERRGPPHQPTFRVAVSVGVGCAEILAEGEGNNRQAAEQEAARLVLERLNQAS